MVGATLVVAPTMDARCVVATAASLKKDQGGRITRVKGNFRPYKACLIPSWEVEYKVDQLCYV